MECLGTKVEGIGEVCKSGIETDGSIRLSEEGSVEGGSVEGNDYVEEDTSGDSSTTGGYEMGISMGMEGNVETSLETDGIDAGELN